LSVFVITLGARLFAFDEQIMQAKQWLELNGSTDFGVERSRWIWNPPPQARDSKSRASRWGFLHQSQESQLNEISKPTETPSKPMTPTRLAALTTPTSTPTPTPTSTPKAFDTRRL
jgi:hypothetical protein